MDDAEKRFTALYDRWYPRVLGYALTHTQPHVAEDIVSETFIVAWHRQTAPDHQSGDRPAARPTGLSDSEPRQRAGLLAGVAGVRLDRQGRLSLDPPMNAGTAGPWR